MRTARPWIELVLAVVVAIAGGLLALGFVIEATKAHEGYHGTLGGDIAGAAVFTVIAVLCSRWAIHAEHWIRAGHPSAEAYAATSTPAGTGTAAPRRFGGRRRYDPVGALVLVVLMPAVTVASIVGTGSGWPPAARAWSRAESS